MSFQRARSDMEVFVGIFVHSTEDNPLIIMPGMVMGVLNTKVTTIELFALLFFHKEVYRICLILWQA